MDNFVIIVGSVGAFAIVSLFLVSKAMRTKVLGTIPVQSGLRRGKQKEGASVMKRKAFRQTTEITDFSVITDAMRQLIACPGENLTQQQMRDVNFNVVTHGQKLLDEKLKSYIELDSDNYNDNSKFVAIDVLTEHVGFGETSYEAGTNLISRYPANNVYIAPIPDDLKRDMTYILQRKKVARRSALIHHL